MNEKRLSDIVDTFAVSGEEAALGSMLQGEFERLGYEIKRDRLGSVFGYKASSQHEKPYKVMITSSLDRLGLIVTDILDSGIITFTSLEPLHMASLLHQRVVIQTRDYSEIEGVICDVEHHYLESSSHSLEKLAIDTGLEASEVSQKISIGDLVSFAPYCNNFGTHKLLGAGLHPCVMNEVVLEVAEALAEVKDLEFDLALGAIAQSTIGFRGTKTITHVIQPDVNLVLCACNSMKSNDGKTRGVMLTAYDKGMLPNRALYKDVYETLHPGVITGKLANDGSFVHKTQRGAAGVALGVLMRNMGTSVEIVDTRDIDALVEGLVEYLCCLTHQKIESFLFGGRV